MTEAEARVWLAHQDVPRETYALLERYVELLTVKSANENLISAASLQHIWSRHIVDSLQLLPLAPPGRWLDLGSGAGLPGFVVALASDRATTLVEPRRRRTAFLHAASAATGIGDRVNIVQAKSQAVADEAGFPVISARAVAPLPQLLASAYHLSNSATRWILPKGRSASREVEAVRASWQGRFVLVSSITDPEAAIIVASEVRPRKRR